MGSCPGFGFAVSELVRWIRLIRFSNLPSTSVQSIMTSEMGRRRTPKHLFSEERTDKDKRRIEKTHLMCGLIQNLGSSVAFGMRLSRTERIQCARPSGFSRKIHFPQNSTWYLIFVTGKFYVPFKLYGFSSIMIFFFFFCTRTIIIIIRPV